MLLLCVISLEAYKVSCYINFFSLLPEYKLLASSLCHNPVTRLMLKNKQLEALCLLLVCKYPPLPESKALSSWRLLRKARAAWGGSINQSREQWPIVGQGCGIPASPDCVPWVLPGTSRGSPPVLSPRLGSSPAFSCAAAGHSPALPGGDSPGSHGQQSPVPPARSHSHTSGHRRC